MTTDVFQNISENLAPIIQLVVDSAYIIGIVMFISAIFSLKKYGEMRGQAYQSQEIFPVLTKMFIGVCLVNFPGFFNSATFTMFATDSAGLLSQDPIGNGVDQNVKTALYGVLGLIGLIAVVRGMLIIQKSAEGQGGAQQGGFGKGLTHVIGGICCYHMGFFIQITKDTLGL